ncbi:MAG: sugar ABC transporter substrate-binding protein [Bacillota bacterium]
MKSRLSWFLVGLMVLVSMGVMARAASSATVEITYYTFSAVPDHLNDLDEIIKGFEKENPGIRVKVMTASWNDYFTKLQTMIATGTAPDTFELNYENFVGYAKRGHLMPLSDLIRKDPTFDGRAYYPRAYEVFRYGGEQYGLVETFSTVVLFYNRDLFQRAGVAFPTYDWTWADELAAAQKLTNQSQRIWGKWQPVQFWEFYKVIAQNGGSIFSPDMRQVVVDSPQNVEALKWLVEPILKYHVSPTNEELAGQDPVDMFKAGKVAMLHTGIWMFGSYQAAPFSWDIEVEPGNVTKANHFFANAVVISRTTKKAEAAWQWIKYFTSSSLAAKVRIRSGWELPALQDMSLMQDYLRQTPPSNRRAVFRALENPVVPPVIESWNEMTDVINQQLELARLGRLTPEQALRNVKPVLEALLRK